MNEDELKKVTKKCFKATTDALMDTLESISCDDIHKIEITHHILKLLMEGTLDASANLLTAESVKYLRDELIEIIDRHLKEEK